MKRKKMGFMVVDSCEDYSCPLNLETGDGLPILGVLSWQDAKGVFIFPTRKQARNAITRTGHYGLAYDKEVPTRSGCVIVPVEMEA